MYTYLFHQFLFLCRACLVGRYSLLLFLFSGTISLPFPSLGLHPLTIHLLMVPKPVSLHIRKVTVFSFQTLFMCIFCLAPSPSPLKSFTSDLPAPLNPYHAGYTTPRPPKVSPTSRQSGSLYLSRLPCSSSLPSSLQ